MRILSVISLSLLPAFAHAAFRVTIDPGHGGTDTGAVHGHLKEADLVLDVGLRLSRLLAREKDIEVNLTRTADHLVSLPDRVKKADQARADLLVSLHANAAPDGRAKGLEFFFQNSLPADEESLFLASLENQDGTADDASDSTPHEISRKGDVSAIVEDLHRESRVRGALRFSELLATQWAGEKGKGPVIKQAPFFVVSHATMPAVLVEIGFLTHSTESKKLAQSAYREELATRLREAITDFRSKLRLVPGRSGGGQVELPIAPR